MSARSCRIATHLRYMKGGIDRPPLTASIRAREREESWIGADWDQILQWRSRSLLFMNQSLIDITNVCPALRRCLCGPTCSRWEARRRTVSRPISECDIHAAAATRNHASKPSRQLQNPAPRASQSKPPWKSCMPSENHTLVRSLRGGRVKTAKKKDFSLFDLVLSSLVQGQC